MIILNQNGNEYVNFDNVDILKTNETIRFDDNNQECWSELHIIVIFNSSNEERVIGIYKDIEYGKEVFLDLLMDYRGNALIEVPKDKIKKNRPAPTGTAM